MCITDKTIRVSLVGCLHINFMYIAIYVRIVWNEGPTMFGIPNEDHGIQITMVNLHNKC